MVAMRKFEMYRFACFYHKVKPFLHKKTIFYGLSLNLEISHMFNQRVKIKALLSGTDAKSAVGSQVVVMGWVRTFRNNQFIALNDGSTNQNIQVVATLGAFDEALLKRITTGASLKVTGLVVESLGKGQTVEVQATTIEVLGDSDAEKYPLQPKKPVSYTHLTLPTKRIV